MARTRDGPSRGDPFKSETPVSFICSGGMLSKPYFLHPSPVSESPRRLTFTWWGCYGLCLRQKPTELAHSFLFRTFVCFCLYGPFNFISFHQFSRQLSVFSLCSSGPISAILALSVIYHFMKVSLSPDKILCG